MKRYIYNKFLLKEVNHIKRVFCFSIIIIFIIGCFSGCKNKKENEDIDTKIAIEIDFLDNELSNFIDIITTNAKTSYGVVEEEAKIKSSKSNNGESDDEKKSSATSGNGENSEEDNSEEITIMSMQYKDQNSVDEENWNEIKNSIKNLYISWATIQSDISTKNSVNEEKFIEINKGLDNLLIYATEQNELSFIKEFVTVYNNLIDIAEKTNYDKNKLNILKTKKKIYESYSNVLEENWDLAKNNIELANDYLQSIDNVENKVIIIFKNLQDSTDKKDKTVFFVKYADALNELNYLSI